MKKLLACILTAILMLTCLTACDLFEKDKNVTCQEYENCAVFTFDDFPIRTSASFELTRTGLGEGAIYYQVNLEAGALSIKYKDTGLIHKDQQLGDFTADDEMPINSSGGYVEGDKITITFESDSPVRGEIIIAFTEDALKAVHGNLQLHEHTGEWVDYNQSTHYYQYTCGCTLPDRIEEHVYNDAYTFCDVCGYELNGGIVEVFFLKDYASWLLELEAEDVAEIKTTFEYVGVAPGRFKDIGRTTDKTVIADVLGKYANTQMRSVAREDTYVDGGSAFTIEFILTDGTVKNFNFNNGFYAYGLDQDEISSLCYFELDSVPTLEGYNEGEHFPVAYSYRFITYRDTAIAYHWWDYVGEQESPICTVGTIGNIEFIAIDRLPDNYTTPIYVLATEFGDIEIYGAFFFDFNGVKYLVTNCDLEVMIQNAGNSEIPE